MILLRRNTILLALCCALFVSCATREPAVSVSNLSTETLVTSLREHDGRLSTLRGSGSMSFESPELSGTASFDVTLKKPDSLLATFEGPFGIDLGTLFMSPRFFEIYNAMQNRVTSGVPDDRALRAFIPFDLSCEQVLEAFAGTFALPAGAIPRRSQGADGEIVLSFVCAGDTCDYWIDPGEGTVTAFRRRDSRGISQLEAECSSFIEKNGARVPKHITVRFPIQRRQLAIHYTSLSINPPGPSFAYTLPRGAQRTAR